MYEKWERIRFAKQKMPANSYAIRPTWKLHIQLSTGVHTTLWVGGMWLFLMHYSDAQMILLKMYVHVHACGDMRAEKRK